MCFGGVIFPHSQEVSSIAKRSFFDNSASYAETRASDKNSVIVVRRSILDLLKNFVSDNSVHNRGGGAVCNWNLLRTLRFQAEKWPEYWMFDQLYQRKWGTYTRSIHTPSMSVGRGVQCLSFGPGTDLLAPLWPELLGAKNAISSKLPKLADFNPPLLHQFLLEIHDQYRFL
jgi:hypothetical protein